MDVKVSKDNGLADGLVERIWSMLDEIEWKDVDKDEGAFTFLTLRLFWNWK